MSGFKHSALSDISQIKTILKDQYDTASVIKELIQNADDAGAEELHLGWMTGVDTAPHPLLRGDAIFALNDGVFSASDNEAIRMLRVGSKGGDVRSIGKFGLGMKSVFHLCEAYFYAASPNQPGSNGQPFASLLNPWSGSQFHADWDNSADALLWLSEHLEGWSQRTSRWFCLWIPVRHQSHLNGTSPIVEQYPSRESFFRKDLHQKLGPYLSMLRTLRKISVWLPDESYGLKQSFCLKLDTEATRRKGPELHDSEPSVIAGTVITTAADTVLESQVDFVGLERRIFDADLQALQCHKSWPTEVTINPETAEQDIVPDKGVPHAAVVLIRAPSTRRRGHLGINRAVFLPLSTTIPSASTSLEHDYQVWLHGCFFLDAGRRDVATGSAEDMPLETEWNKRLEEVATLPLLPSALSFFHARTQASTEEIRQLTESLAEVKFFRDRMQYVSSEAQWMLRVTRPSMEWTLLDASTPYYVIPQPPDGDADLPFRTIPHLEHFAAENALTYTQCPRLSNLPQSPWPEDFSWEEGLTANGVFGTMEQLRWFVKFVTDFREELTERAWVAIVQILRGAIVRLGWKQLRSMGGDVRALVALLPRALWMTVPEHLLKLKGSEQLLTSIADSSAELLVLPQDLAPESEPELQGLLSVSGGRAVLEAVAARAAAADKSLSAQDATALAIFFLTRMKGTTEQKRDACCDLPLFTVLKLSTRVESTVSLNKIDELRQTGLLFSGRSGAGQDLEEALKEGEVFGLLGFESSKLPDEFIAGGLPSTCDARACVTVLRSFPELAEPSKRFPLLRWFISTSPTSVGQEAYRTTLRYLLHGSIEGASDNTTPLMLTGHGWSDLWEGLAFKLLKIGNQQWRAIDPLLGNQLSPDVRSRLGVQPLSRPLVEQLLGEFEQELQKESYLNADERAALLKEVEDRGLWLKLPIHETVYGEITSALDAYFSSDIPVAKCISASVKILRLPADVVAAQRYKQAIREWDAESALTALLRQAAPHEIASDILDVLASVPTGIRLSAELLAKLESTRWIVSRSGPRAPRDVIRIDELRDDVARLLGSIELDGAYIQPEAIDEHLTRHEGFRFVQRKLLPGRHETIELLTMCIGDLPTYAIGAFADRAVEDEFVCTLLDAFGSSCPPAMHGIAFLRAARNAGLTANELTRLARAACRSLDPTLLRVCLEALAARDVEARGDERDLCRAVYLWYLEEYVSSPGFEAKYLAGLNLPNADGNWRPATELAFEYRGVSGADLIDSDVADVIRPSWRTDKQPRVSPTGSSVKVSKGSLGATVEGFDALKKFFRQWEQRVPHEAIGAFLALLGTDKQLEKLADQYLQPRWSVSALRMRLADADAAEILGQTQIDVGLLHTPERDSIPLPSIAGPKFAASLVAKPESLLVGNASRVVSNELPNYEITLRAIDPKRFERTDLISLLEASARTILSTVLRKPVSSLDALFEEVCDIEQSDLKLAQALILENAFFYFRQLPINGRRDVSQIISEWNKLQREAIQCEGDKKRIVEVDRQKRQIRANLQRWFETADEDLQSDMLAAVRAKVTEYQYQPTSIPFELFQNADDAAVELVEMAGGGPASPYIDKIGVRLTDNSVTWMHWGRPINLFRYGTFPTEVADQRGYHKDLEKMLVLSSSDKSVNKDGVTGKFGLGFKSVFLYTDEPILLSGSLGVRIVAGMFPSALDEEARERLHAATAALGGHELDATVIELAARVDATPPEALFEMFWPNVPLLLAFARRIKTCVVDRPVVGRSESRWREQPLTESGHLAYGFADASGGVNVSSFKALMLRGAEASAMMIRLGPRGAIPLDADVPTLWVTAPTSEKSNACVAVNGSFQLDVGRGQLARGRDENNHLAMDMGSAFGAALVELADQSMDWRGLCETLDLAGDTTPYEFWDSILRVSSSRSVLDNGSQGSDAASLVRTMLWRDGCGVARLVRQRPVVPTRLPGRFGILTSLDTVRYQTRGLLEHESVLRCVMNWPEASRRIDPGTIVSGSELVTVLKRAGVSIEAHAVGVSDLLRWERDAGRDAPPERAAILGRAFTAEVQGSVDGGSDYSREFDEILAVLQDFRFRARDGRYHEPGALVVGHEDVAYGVDDDELLRAAFAPPSNVLDSEYGDAALLLFTKSRRSLRADARTLAEWGIAAGDADRRRSFLRYLLDGKLAREVADEVIKPGTRSWIQTIQSPDQLDGFSFSEQLRLLGLLKAVRSLSDLTPIPDLPAYVPQPRPTLEAIYGWWSDLSASERKGYADRAYHEPQILDAITPEYGGTHAERKSWITLMLRASLETMGRTTPEQHKSYVARLDKDGWLDDLASSPAREAETAVRRFREHTSELIQEAAFYHWTKNLLPLTVFLTWLDDYARSFLWINHCDRKHSLKTILNPRTNSQFQGGGPDAPPLGSVLGIGACYMLRELVRLGAVTNPHFHRYCYVPTKKVRDLVSVNSDSFIFIDAYSRESQAEVIWSQVVDVLGEESGTMHLAFDIPLRIVANDGALQIKLLGATIFTDEDDEDDLVEEVFEL